MDKKVRVRFAPSPTGCLHSGGIRTALFNYLFAKKHGGEFVLRIEDTDQKRFVPGAEEYVIDALKWLGISPDEGIGSDGKASYRQSEKEYKSFVDILLANGNAYYAFDTNEELEVMRKTLQASKASTTSYSNVTRNMMKNSFTLSSEEVERRIESGENYVIRFNMPKHKIVEFTDVIKGSMSVNTNNLDDKVLFKSNGLPSYHLANVVDDHRMDITHVIRGEEWIPSTPLHILLYEAFGWEKPYFCHLPLVLGPDGKKMSKRKTKDYNCIIFPIDGFYLDEDDTKVDVKGFREAGYESDAILNHLALIGWNPGTKQEIMTKDEMISLFSLERVNNSSAMFDTLKLNDFNSIYMRSREHALLWNKYIWPHIANHDCYNKELWKTIVDLAKERSVLAKELYKSVSYFFEKISIPDDVVIKNPLEFKTVMSDFIKNVDSVVWDSDSISSAMNTISDNYGFKHNKILPDLRMALTGGQSGPLLSLTMEIMGKEDSVHRIESLIKYIKVAE